VGSYWDLWAFLLRSFGPTGAMRALRFPRAIIHEYHQGIISLSWRRALVVRKAQDQRVMGTRESRWRRQRVLPQAFSQPDLKTSLCLTMRLVPGRRPERYTVYTAGALQRRISSSARGRGYNTTAGGCSKLLRAVGPVLVTGKGTKSGQAAEYGLLFF
jgi:hypothetical protein